MRSHMHMISRYSYYWLDAGASYRGDAWNLPLGMEIPHLVHYLLRCIADSDGSLRLCDLLIKMQDPSAILVDVALSY